MNEQEANGNAVESARAQLGAPYQKLVARKLCPISMLSLQLPPPLRFRARLSFCHALV